MIPCKRFAFLLLKGRNQQHILIVDICILIERWMHLENKGANSAGNAAVCTELMRKHCLLTWLIKQRRQAVLNIYINDQAEWCNWQTSQSHPTQTETEATRQKSIDLGVFSSVTAAQWKHTFTLCLCLRVPRSNWDLCYYWYWQNNYKNGFSQQDAKSFSWY